MVNSPSIKRNLAYSVAYQVLAVVAPLITVPYVSRVLGAEGIGIYSYTNSLMALFSLFALLGTGNYGTREIARLRDSREEMSAAFWGIVSMKGIAAGCMSVVWLLTSLIYEEYRIYMIALTPNLLSAFLDISWFFTGLEQMGRVVFRNSVVKVAGIVLLFFVVKDEGDLLAYILMLAMINVFANATMWPYLKRELVRVPRGALDVARHFKESMVYFVPTIGVSVYLVMDKTMIGLITGDALQNGYYEQSDKVISMAKSVSFVALNAVMTARMSYLFESGKTAEVKERLKESLGLALLACVGLSFGIGATAATFVPVFFGPGYEPAVFLLQVMSPLVAITAVSSCLTSLYFIPAGRIGDNTRIIFVAAGANLVFNAALIPFMGAFGAVVGSLASQALMVVLSVAAADGFYSFGILARALWKKVAAGFAMGACIVAFSAFSHLDPLPSLLIQIAGGATLYAVFALAVCDSSAVQVASFATSKLAGALKRGGQ